MPDIQISYLAIALAVFANFILGFVWYTFLFKRAWAIEMGFDPDMEPEKGEMQKGMLLTILGNIFMVWVLAHTIAVWNPVTWGLAPNEYSDACRALLTAFFSWLGFSVPLLLSGVAWGRQSWKLFSINAAYYLLAMAVVAMILVFVK